ncbi:hypothetical protein [Streptomyces huiliensis]|nr:hypothetical protein [Streptomyces huiliensis]
MALRRARDKAEATMAPAATGRGLFAGRHTAGLFPPREGRER